MAEERVQRRLAAILAADVVGYSRLMEIDEEGTRARLLSLYAELLNPRIATDGGRIVKTMGDGILVEFPSAVDAVRNALAMQRAVQRRNIDISEDYRIEFRVGINVGDIIVEGDDIHGEGVNVASRLEGLCEPGKVFVSGTVYDQIGGKLSASFDNLGEQHVKNIAKPVRVYRAREDINLDAEPELLATVTPKLPDKPSIAVLPFDNLSGDSEQEYFSDGMAEDLITDLSKISGLFVIARNSSFAFKEQTVDVKDIAGKLGVEHILEGSVRKMGDKLRVNVQLIDAASGGHLWAERYDGDMEDIFDFQDAIREQIVSALQVNLTPTDKTLTERKPTDSVQAYDLFLRGRSNLHIFAPESVREAIASLEKSIEIDPNFADAYSRLAFCLFTGWVHVWSGFDNGLERATELAEKAVELDRTSADAFMARGWFQAYLLRYDQSVEDFEKATALAPNNAEVCALFGAVLNRLGNPNKGLEMLEKAFSLEVFAPPNWEMYAGCSYLLLRRYDEALTRISRAIERAPKFIPSYPHLAWAYVELNSLDDAREAIKTFLEIVPQFTVKKTLERWSYQTEQNPNRFLDALRKAGVPEG